MKKQKNPFKPTISIMNIFYFVGNFIGIGMFAYGGIVEDTFCIIGGATTIILVVMAYCSCKILWRLSENEKAKAK